MSTDMNEWKEMWQAGKTAPVPDKDSQQILAEASLRKRSSLYAQYGNAVILTITMIVIYLFFIVLYPYQEVISNIGVWMMVGGLALRIAVEIYSIMKIRRISIAADVLHNTERTVAYFKWRQFIHKEVTYTIVALYSIGFYLLMPEFSRHAPMALTISLVVIYPIGAAILIWQIRKGIRKEMEDLSKLVDMQKQLEG